MKEGLNDNQRLNQISSVSGKGFSWFLGFLCFLALVGLLILSRHNYLLYHSVVEVLSVVVAATIFSIGWNSRHFVQDNTLLVLAVAYLPIGVLDFLHTLSYKGMGVIPGLVNNMPPQLWVSARFIESGALLWAAILLGKQKRLNSYLLLSGAILVGGVLVVSIVKLRFFPTCFVEGMGLTTFKVVSEYVISGLLLLAAAIFWRRRQFLDQKILQLLIGAVLMTVCSEFSFTLYTDLYGLSNFIGHAFKLFSIVLIYFALVQGSLVSPYQSLFRKLSIELSQRKASEEKLRTANRELDAFVYTVSHDLRSPLTPIIGFAEYLQEKNKTSLDAQSLELLQEIGDLGHRMSESMDDLLTLAKVGKIEVVTSPVNTEEVVDRVLIALGSLVVESGQHVKKGSLPEVRFPESLLTQVFSNLLGNALRYGEGDVEVGGERHGNLIRFYVSDQGPGIPETEREKIFELFFRGSGGDQAEGTGVGLAIIHKIVGLYNGRVWVEETMGGGSTFWVEMEEPADE